MRVIDVAHRDVATVGPETTVAEAARIMLSGGARALVVAEAGRIVGILTERDIVARLVSRDRPLSTPVAAVMTQEPVTIPASASTAQAYAALRDHGFRRLPVVDDGRVVGLLELDDLGSELAGEALSAYGHCPHCGSEQLRTVCDGESSNLLCLTCRNCWRLEQGQLVRVDPDTCPGCPDRLYCMFPAVGS